MHKDSVIKIKSSDEETKEYRVVLSFRWNKTKKDYLVYTDDTLDENGALKLYAATYHSDKPYKFTEVETEEEWQKIEKLLLENAGKGEEQ